MDNINHYLNRRTIIVGDVNSGKTSRTFEILQMFLEKGYAKKIAILDMGTNPIQGIGGKMIPPPDVPTLYLTSPIYAPRLMGKDPNHIRSLAEENARSIERLFLTFQQQKREILFVNDATLYLQAGHLERFLEILNTTSTQIINAYYGDAFGASELTRREKKLTEDLMGTCHHLVTLP
jgi:hypothetical protein